MYARSKSALLYSTKFKMPMVNQFILAYLDFRYCSSILMSCFTHFLYLGWHLEIAQMEEEKSTDRSNRLMPSHLLSL